MRKPTATATAGVAAVVAVGFLAWSAAESSTEATADPGAAPAPVRAGGEQAADTASGQGETLPADAVPPTSAQDTLAPAENAVLAHQRADRGPEQPIPFSHRFHVSELQVDCEYCHSGTRSSQAAVMPPVSVCMGCHTTVGGDLPPIGQLRSYWEREEPVPWNQVYKVPEFVQFNHRAHLRNQIQCQECHGPVQEMDRIYRVQELTMGWCLSCHRQEPRPGDVATTARLAARADVPETPEGRQPVGLYPRRISSGYASYRAPDDCATCHY